MAGAAARAAKATTSPALHAAAASSGRIALCAVGGRPAQPNPKRPGSNPPGAFARVGTAPAAIARAGFTLYRSPVSASFGARRNLKSQPSSAWRICSW
jgi:hypothetical protein